MKTNHTARRGFTLVELLVVIVIIAALAGLTAPMVIRQRKKADQTEAVSNAKQIGLALFEFENEYSSYPSTNTAQADIAGATANDLFRQLIAANFTQNEKMFYAKIPNVKKPDENITGAEALKAGEVGFGYLLNGIEGFSAAGNSSRPIAVTPLLDNGTNGQFDPEPFDNKAIVLRMDNSVTSITVRQDKEIILSGTKKLLEKGEDSVWGTSSTPTLAAPLLKTN
jgi:prepilin-type N-terminal cleavage/methylation domain-containing protein